MPDHGMPHRLPGGPGHPGPGRVRIRSAGGGVVELVGLAHLPVEEEQAARVVTGLIEEAFEHGQDRVEAEVLVEDVATRKVLQRCGMRPEGVARALAVGGDGRRVDVTRLARLREDPPPGTPQAFLAMLDASLPRKRVIVQGLARDPQGRVLLCELTYKEHWDLPGGVADPAESPAASLEREVSEELGLELPVGRLLAVDWLPPYRQWSDAVLLVFDLAVGSRLTERATLQRSELRGLHWVPPGEVHEHVAPYVQRLLGSLVGDGRHAAAGVDPVFLEDGVPRELPAG